MHGFRNQVVEMGEVLLTITPSDPLGKGLLSVPATSNSVGLQVLVPRGGVLSPGNTTLIPMNWKLKLPPCLFRLLLPLNQQSEKGITLLTGVMDPDYPGEIGLHLHNGDKDKFAWNTGDPLGHLLVLPSPMTKVNGKLQQPNSSRINNGPESSGMKVWVTPPSKEPWAAEMLIEDMETWNA
ncbi:deoxyuridine 5'-triphosphate nucleotidohydrolase-like [Dasypus novemcinctus]|uniref:deoxyuridine 5'-triphosphate nucleotidohydrolase-like n=1 Tax=Dasypus novemcinctus TaxID=9361 RepID=UPI0039C9D960